MNHNHAIIFANGDANDGVMVSRVLATTASALLIAADGGAHVAAAYQLTPHVVIGDMDSVTPEVLAALEAGGAQIIRYPIEKNETDLELALLLAAERGATSVRVIGALGDRLDQTLANVYLLALPALATHDVRIVAGAQEAWLYDASNGACTIHGAVGDTLSLLPLGGGVSGVTTEGLYYPLRDEDLRFGPARGVSNVLTHPHATVTARSGVLLIVHTAGRA